MYVGRLSSHTHNYLNGPESQEGIYDFLVRVPVSARLNTTIFSGVKSPFFPNAEEDPIQVNERYKKTLEAIGGEKVFLKGCDGTKLEAMYFDQEFFQKSVMQQLDSLVEIGAIAHPERDQECKLLQPRERCMQVLESNDAEKIEALKSLGVIVEVEQSPFEGGLEVRGFDRNTVSRCIDQKHATEKPLYVMYLPATAAEGRRENGNPRSTAVICGGSGVLYSVYKPLIARLLMNGMNVIAFNYRGYGESEGAPTDKRLHQDLGTVMGYLHAKGVKEENILLYANCMGLGVASKYAAEHPDCDLLIDRSFARYHDVAADCLVSDGLTRTAAIVRKSMPWVVNFDNASHLPKVKGKVGVVLACDDQMVVPEQTQQLLDAIPETSLKFTLVTEGFGHTGNWLKSPVYMSSVESFLHEIGKSQSSTIRVEKVLRSD